ncbi:hypothetical protein BH09PSE6_BH09PSE6_17700 [soil metagenome]
MRMTRSRALKAGAVVAALLVAGWLLFAWLGFEPLVKWAAHKVVADKSAHQLTIDQARFNPFTLTFDLGGVKLADPDGKPLMSLARIVVDLQASGLFRRAWTFKDIRITEPKLDVELRADGLTNWTALARAFASSEPEPAAPSATPRLLIRHAAIDRGRIDFSDAVVDGGFKTQVDPLDLDLNEISTLPDDTGNHVISAKLGNGAMVRWTGNVALNPLLATGDFALTELPLASIWPLLQGAAPRMAPPEGKAALQLDYRLARSADALSLQVDKLDAHVDSVALRGVDGTGPLVTLGKLSIGGGTYDLASGAVKIASIALDNLQLPAAAGSAPLLALPRLQVETIEASLPARTASVARLQVVDAQLSALRDSKGQVPWLDAIARLKVLAQPAADAPAPAVSPAVTTPAWKYHVGSIDVTGLQVAARDETMSPALTLALSNGQAQARDLSENLAAPIPVRLAFDIAGGGRFEAEGSVVPATPQADLGVKLVNLPLKLAQPVLADKTTLTLERGTLGAAGKVAVKGSDARYDGSFAIDGLRIDKEDGDRFIAWKTVSARRLIASSRELDIPELLIDRLDTKIVITKDRTIDVSKFLKHPETAPAPPAAAAPVAAKATAAAPSFGVKLQRLQLRDSDIDFSDLSLALPFRARVHHLKGDVVGLSNAPGAVAQVKLDGGVSRYGLARVNGSLDIANPTGFTDIKVEFRNIEMTELTPYSATFAGRKIESGKLALDLEYKLKDRQLLGENRVVMDQLTLGEHVEGASVANLPLDLAIAILQDSDGRIDLGLPVSGNLDDPQFSYGGIIWKAVTNIIGKIVTAPFRALGALFGGGSGSSEKAEQIAFDPGASALLGPERETLDTLAQALAKRPGLALTVHAPYDDKVDRAALQDLQVRRTLAERTGRQLAPGDDPGPVSLTDPATQKALEALYTQRADAAVKLPSTPDRYAPMYQRVVQTEPVADDRMVALAGARADVIRKRLVAKGVAEARVKLQAPEKISAKDSQFAARLELDAAPK